MLILFVDDVRDVNFKIYPGYSVLIARNYNEAIKLIEEYEFDIITLDHDLGEEKTGYDIAKYIEEKVLTNKWNKKIPIIKCHSANPVGFKNIMNASENIERKKNDKQSGKI